MPPKVKCPECGTEKWIGPGNPHQCESEECEAEFNVNTRDIQIPIDIDPEFADKVIAGFTKAGERCLQDLRKRFAPWKIFPVEKGKCSLCEEEKKLTMSKDGDRYCSSCGQDQLYRDDAVRKEMLSSIKEDLKSEIPRMSLIDMAFDRAKTLFGKWVSDNWSVFAASKKLRDQLQNCKTGAKGEKSSEIFEEQEPSEITKIRKLWRNSNRPVSPHRYFSNYYNGTGRYQGTGIRKSNRKQRRERLKHLSSEEEWSEDERKCSDLAFAVGEPTCKDCDHLTRFEWGWECELQHDLIKSNGLQITDFPSFPQNLVDIKGGGNLYQISKDEIRLRIWEARGNRYFPIWSKKDRDWREQWWQTWLEDYDYQEFGNARKTILRRDSEGNYYFHYPRRDVTLIEPGDWTHYVAYGPSQTCVLSKDGEQEKVKFFNNGDVIAHKQYHSARKREAQEDEKSGRYWRIPRTKEQDMVKLTLHNLATDINEYLSGKPGQVVLLNLQKDKFSRGDWKQSELNTALSQWPESIFRSLIKYKLELEGLSVKEKKFDLSEDATCPYCGSGLRDSWQNLRIIEGQKQVKCGCGSEVNMVLGMAKKVQA